MGKWFIRFLLFFVLLEAGWAVFFVCLVVCLLITIYYRLSIENADIEKSVPSLGKYIGDEKEGNGTGMNGVEATFIPEVVDSTEWRSLDEFRESLAVVWAGDDLPIEFSYRNLANEYTRRNIDLKEVLVNDREELYFSGWCHLSGNFRTFKVKRIQTKILFDGRKYDRDDFIEEILLLDPYDFS